MNARPTTLRVPVAITPDGHVVRPEEAGSSAHTCPGCGAPVGLRGGPGSGYQRHFYHLDDTVSCAPESVLHRAAKRLIARAVNDFGVGVGPAPATEVVCDRSVCRRAWFAPLPARLTHAEEEVRLPSGRVADVGVMSAGVISAAVEIHVTHAVGAEKAENLRAEGVPWIELEAAQVIEDPLRWRGISGTPKARRCPDCVALLRAISVAGLPAFVENLDPARHSGEVVAEVLREGDFVVAHLRIKSVGEVVPERRLHHVRVAQLGSPISHDAWCCGLRRFAPEAKRRRIALGLPAYVDDWFVVEATMREWGGAWMPNLDTDWSGREDRSDPDAARARWIDLRRIAAETMQPIPDRTSAFWAEPYRCFAQRCRGEMLVYSWKGQRWMDDTAPPEVGRPESVMYRDSKRGGGAYWANVCPHCGRIQGANFVHQPAGPLRRLRG